MGVKETIIPVKNIVIGQKIQSTKAQRARELRRKMTPEEKTLWQALRRNQLAGFHFRRQQVIDGFIVDFYCHAAALVIEIDGGIHQGQPDYDTQRDQILQAHGLRVMRIRNEAVMENLAGVLASIEAICRGVA